MFCMYSLDPESKTVKRELQYYKDRKQDAEKKGESSELAPRVLGKAVTVCEQLCRGESEVGTNKALVFENQDNNRVVCGYAAGMVYPALYMLLGLTLFYLPSIRCRGSSVEYGSESGIKYSAIAALSFLLRV